MTEPRRHGAQVLAVIAIGGVLGAAGRDGIGVLGGYTTFSTYTLEVQSLLASGHPELAVGYLFGTAAAALAAVAIGVTAARALVLPPNRRGGPS